MSIHLTQAQARAIAEISAREGEVSLHQLAHDESVAAAEDVYVTPGHRPDGYRIAANGEVGAFVQPAAARG